MRRRELLAALGAGALSVPLASFSQSQPAKIPTIGFLSPFSPSATSPWLQAFQEGLRERGWNEGKNIRIEYRYADGMNDRLPDLVADLIRLNVAIIVASVTTDALIAKGATKTIPIVVAAAGDPVASGLVKTLARPGGNVTGLSQVNPALAGKRLELLKEIVPKLTRVAVLGNPRGTASVTIDEIQGPARQLGIQLVSLEVRTPADLEKAMSEATRVRVGALIILPDPMIATNLERIAELAAKSRLPSIHGLLQYANLGGLAAYGADRADMFRRAASYVDKILKGAKPADLPVEQPTKFELAINLKTAKALGITIPTSVRLRADRVIE